MTRVALPLAPRGAAAHGAATEAARQALGDTHRPGFSLVELLSTLVLGGLVAAAVAGTLRSAERLARVHAARVAAAETLRVPGVVLSRELRWVDTAEDLAALSRDSLRIRAFRGTAVVCGAVGGAVYVRYTGVRQPNPAKDSLLAIDADGRAQAFALDAARTDAAVCAARGGVEIQRWAVGAPLAVGTLLLLFESGSYYLVDGAFRYGRGRGGRQPLTAEVLDGSATGFHALDIRGAETADPELTAALDIRLAVDAARWGSARSSPPLPPARLRMTFVNGDRIGIARGSEQP